jgi:hypothetical protein
VGIFREKCCFYSLPFSFFLFGVKGRIGEVGLLLPSSHLPSGGSLFACGSTRTTTKKRKSFMPCPDKKPVKAYLTSDEHQQLVESAAKAGLTVSTFIKRVCLGQRVQSIVDHQAVLAVMKANADLGRLGGLFKKFLSEGNAVGPYADDLLATLRSIEATKAQVVKECSALVQAITQKDKGLGR